MNTKYSIFFAVTVLINDLTFMANAFLLFSSLKSDVPMKIDYLPWLACALSLLFLNRLFLRKPRKIIHMAVLNGLLDSIFMVTGFLYIIHVQGITAYTFAALFFILSAGRSVWLAMNPIPERYLVLYTEFSIMGTGFYFLAQAGPFDSPILNNLACLLSIVLNITALIRQRVFAENRKVTSVSKWKSNFLLLGFIGTISGLVAGFFLFLSAPMGSILRQTIHAALLFLKWTGFQLSRLLYFLVSLLPEINEKAPPLPEHSMQSQTAAEGMTTDFSRLIPLLAAGIGSIVVLIVAVLVIRYRRRLSNGSFQIKFQNENTTKASTGIYAPVLEFIRKTVRKIRLGILFIRLRNTPEGVFLLMEIWGSKKGIPRKPGETSASYLSRLSQAFESLNKQHLGPLVSKLAAALDERFYSRPSETHSASLLDRTEIKALRRNFSLP